MSTRPHVNALARRPGGAVIGPKFRPSTAGETGAVSCVFTAIPVARDLRGTAARPFLE